MSDVFDSLDDLGFTASRAQIEALLSHAIKSRLTAVQVVEQLVDIERRAREARNLAARTKRATVGGHTTMDRFEWSHPTSIDRALCEEQVMSLGFVARRKNVLFRGPAGIGKTMLAQNTCIAALAAGLTVCFTNVASALADLLRQESLPAVERRLRRYTHVDLLVCDELGYLPMDTRAADLFFQILSRRHEKASTIITTNLAFRDWGSVFPGAACLVPLIDRFTQHLVTIDIEGESYRQKPPPTTTPAAAAPEATRPPRTTAAPTRRRAARTARTA